MFSYLEDGPPRIQLLGTSVNKAHEYTDGYTESTVSG
jgi:hypothetical protein